MSQGYDGTTFTDDGLVHIDWRDAGDAEQLRRALLARAVTPQCGHDVHIPAGTRFDGSLDGGQGRRYWCMDGIETALFMPSLYEWAAELPALASEHVGREVIGSPYVRSGIMPKVYWPGDWHGRHRDTNPLTALVYLDDVGVTSIDARQPSPRGRSLRNGWEVKAHPGSLLLFAGRELEHEVRPVDQVRAVVAFNLYYPDDVWRPADYDRITFGA